MSKKYKIVGLGLLVFGVLITAIWYLHGLNIAVLNPKGPIAQKERHLMIVAILLMLVVVVPVFILTAFVAWKYRENNTKQTKYSPNWDHSRLFETVWWLIPSLLILVLAVITWRATHQLDPYRPIASTVKPLTIQVVALDWKWLFIYPEQHVASVNFVQFPVNTPINFEITSDATMNSLWIPQLAGQIYAMPGMSTELHLMASQVGNYRGSSANISGQGFAGMKFIAHANSTSAFSSWSASLKRFPPLSQSAYNLLSQPTTDNTVAYYSYPVANLYSNILLKYMGSDTQMFGMKQSVTETQ